MTPERTVLIVEDDSDFAASLKLVVAMRGYKVDVVHSGEEALEVFVADRHSLVLMDIRLPGINGIETLRQLKERSAELPIMIMTGCEQSSEEAHLARSAGATELLFKPFKIKQMLDRLDGILHTHRKESR